ncbi:MAG: NAD-binding protein [Candidatus Accumulibacter sp.]|uniref:potassium channel family protein n=1 Tax=Accumulibacter sp. TaxID=2053492 RepID=UPI001A50631C|nr:potassium channel family protein [Accumulibacter sp.]MBL8396303.1 NAD-binding protein [Accumulibacter sp.]
MRVATQLQRIVVRIVWAGIAVLALIAIGTVGFYQIAEDNGDWSDALYMTLITISTVGYGEIVPLLSPSDRIFAGSIAISGLGALTFLFTSLSVFFLEKDLDHSLRRRRMEKRIQRLRQHFIICGFGRVGRSVGGELQNTGRHFVAIDVEDARFEDNLDKFPGLLYLQGDASDDDLLEAADIADARGLFAVTGDDSRNLMIIITARQLNPDLRIVARAQESRNVEKMRKVGADAVISPDFTGGIRLASAMVRPHVVSFLDEMIRSDKNVRLEEVRVPAGFPTTRVGDLRLRSPDYILLAVREEDGAWVFNPKVDDLVNPGSTIIALSNPSGRAQLKAHLIEVMG